MPTFYEVYQEYRTDPRSLELTRKKYRELHHYVKNYYDKWNQRQPIQYQKFTNEAGEPCEVRLYPDIFVSKMKFLIIDFCERYKANLAANEAIAKKAEPPPQPVPEKRKRTRKPIPVFSLKK